MKTNSKHLKNAVMMASVVVFSTVTIGTAVQASSLPVVQAKPSGIIITPFSVFDSSFKTLDNGSASIANKGSGKIVISADTNAKSKTSTIGVSFVLQKWDGSTWSDVYSSGSSTKANTSYIIVSQEKSVSTGYYYRVKTQHWTINNGVKEQGERVTGSYLVN